MSFERTSREAYAAIAASGVLGDRQLDVYEWICRHEHEYQFAVSRLDVAEGFNGNDQTYGRRIKDLAEIGVVTYIGEKANRGTGRQAKAYCTTTDLSPNMVSVMFQAWKARRDNKDKLTHGEALKRAVRHMTEIKDELRSGDPVTRAVTVRKLERAIALALNRRRDG